MDNYTSTMAVDYTKVLNGNQYLPALNGNQYLPSLIDHNLDDYSLSESASDEQDQLVSSTSMSTLLINPYSGDGAQGLGLVGDACLVESQKYVLPRFLTTHLAQGFKWDYSDILRDLRARSSLSAFEAYLASLLKLTHLYEDFVRSARLNAKVLIGQVWKNKGRMSKVGLGGVAGGSKFIRDSILFKFNSDDRADIYDGIFNAFKAGSRELSNASTLFALLYHKYPSYNVPFFTIVDYCGYQVTCIALLPLEKDNMGLCYGSSDGGTTVMKDKSVENEVEEVARQLNLAPHLVNGKEGKIIISHATDIEVHRGTNGAYYFLDIARLFPPEAPVATASPKTIFYNHLRPEFVMSYERPLCADGFSGFLKADPEYLVRANIHLSDATEKLFKDILPQAAQAPQVKNFFLNYFPSVMLELNKDKFSIYYIDLLLTGVVDTECDEETTSNARKAAQELQLRVKSNLLRRFNIKKHCHKYGINMRMIGYMYLHANVEPFKLRLLIEMIARTAKNTLRALMKFTYDTEKRIETSSMNRTLIEFLNLLLGDSDEAVSYWESEFFESLLRIYFYRGISDEDKESLREELVKLQQDHYFKNEVQFRLQFFLNVPLQGEIENSSPFDDFSGLDVPEFIHKMSLYCSHFPLRKYIRLIRLNSNYNFRWQELNQEFDTSEQWISRAAVYFELALSCLEDYALMQQQDCDRFPLHLFFDVKLVTTLLTNCHEYRTNVLLWYAAESFLEFSDRKNALYKRATIFFHKICLFNVYFSVELIFEKIQEILKDVQSFRIVESQFPGQIQEILENYRYYCFDESVGEVRWVWDRAHPYFYMTRKVTHNDSAFYCLSLISRILLYRVYCLQGETTKAVLAQRDLYNFLIYNRPLTDSYYLSSFFNVHNARAYSNHDLGGKFSFHQWEIFQSFEEVTNYADGKYGQYEHGVFFRLHFFEFAFNKEFAIQMTKTYGIFDVWEVLRLLFLATAVGLECDRVSNETTKSPKKRKGRERCSPSSSASGSTLSVFTSLLAPLFRAAPDVMRQIVMLVCDLFFPVLISPDVLNGFRNNVLMLDDPRDVLECKVELYRSHAYIACTEKYCFFCNKTIPRGKQQIVAFKGRMNLEVVVLANFYLNVLTHAPEPDRDEDEESAIPRSMERAFGVKCGCDPSVRLRQLIDPANDPLPLDELVSFHETDLHSLNAQMTRRVLTPEEYLVHLHKSRLNRCTFVREGRFSIQPYYNCNDCGYQACVICALTCHNGHSLSVTMQGDFFCDCGLHENQHKCVFLRDWDGEEESSYDDD